MAPPIEDFGEKLGGANKDRFVGAVLANVAVDDLSAYFEARGMTKDILLGAIDYPAEVAAGKPADLCFLYKTVRDALPAFPRLGRIKAQYREEVAAMYVECLRKIKEAFTAARRAEDLVRLDRQLVPVMTEVKNGKTYLTHRASCVAHALGGNRGFLAVQIYPARLDEIRLKVAETGWPTPGANSRLTDEHRAPDIVRPCPEQGGRTGLPDWRGGEEVSQALFDSTFGFRAGEFGNWASERERQDFYDHLFDALKDMGALGLLPDQALSLNRRLAFAFGSRGRANAVAHYEPALRVIHFTKLKWMGSVAHEWAHALDHLLFESVCGADDGSDAARYLVTRIWSRGDDCLSADHHTDLQRAYRRYFDLCATIPRGQKNSMAGEARVCDYGRAKVYFNLPEEIFARCFEFAVASKLGDRRSDYLVYGTDNEFYAATGVRPYPDQSLARAFAEWFDEFMGAVRKTLGGNYQLRSPVRRADTCSGQDKPKVGALLAQFFG